MRLWGTKKDAFVDNIFIMSLIKFCKKAVKVYLCRRVMRRSKHTLP